MLATTQQSQMQKGTDSDIMYIIYNHKLVWKLSYHLAWRYSFDDSPNVDA